MQSQNNYVRNRKIIALFMAILIPVAVVAVVIWMNNRSTGKAEEEITYQKYDPISHEVYTETNQEPEFEGEEKNPQYLGFQALSNDFKAEYYHYFLEKTTEYVEANLADKGIKYVSLDEESLKSHIGEDFSYRLTFTIYFNSEMPTDVLFETYPDFYITYTPQE